MKILHGSTTYKKGLAIENQIISFLEHGYEKVATFLIACDYGGKAFGDMPSALELKEKYKKDCEIVVAYGKKAAGVAGNKNRIIDYALKHPEFTHVSTPDDDQVFIRPGLYEELVEVLRACNLNHVTGQWNSTEPELLQATGEGWTSTFPVEAEAYHVTFHDGGSHGNFHFYTRKCLEQIGYWDVMTHRYGYEHALHTARALQVVDKRSFRFHPQHSRAWYYYQGQSVPNNYEVSDPHANSKQYLEILGQICSGLSLKITCSGLNPKEETVL